MLLFQIFLPHQNDISPSFCSSKIHGNVVVLVNLMLLQPKKHRDCDAKHHPNVLASGSGKRFEGFVPSWCFYLYHLGILESKTKSKVFAEDSNGMIWWVEQMISRSQLDEMIEMIVKMLYYITCKLLKRILSTSKRLDFTPRNWGSPLAEGPSRSDGGDMASISRVWMKLQWYSLPKSCYSQ